MFAHSYLNLNCARAQLNFMFTGTSVKITISTDSKMTAKSTISYNLNEISSAFLMNGEVVNIVAYGSGHINDTFHVKTSEESDPDYLLQRINQYVFTDVPGLMKNIELVTAHVREKMVNSGDFDASKHMLTLIPTHQRQFYHEDAAGNYWRMYYFLPNTTSYDIVETAQQAYEGGKAFGEFQACLSDMDARLLVETIPDFHNIEKRIATLKKVVNENPAGRVTEVKEELDFIMEREQAMNAILNMGKSGLLPLRITHNDTKFSNVLLDVHDKAQCVIDLDTVMPGYVAYDFGDAIRSSANTAAEDEAELEKIDVNLEIFEAFTAGFLSETGDFLSDAEVDSLVLGALLFPYLMGVRFLTDYIDGDKYYKINTPKHNLQRAKAQFQLLKKLEYNYDAINKIVLAEANKMRVNSIKQAI